MELDFTKTYIFNDTEVKLTGRIAEKAIPVIVRNKENKKPKISTLYEITPLDKELGSWKKWIRLVDLYEIKS